MLKTNIKMAVRTMWKDRFYSLLHISGFAIGQACCIIAYLIVKEGVYLAALPALLVLLLVCLNYVSIATARPGRRAAETGIRKALGSEPGRLFREYLPEGVLVSFFALLPALVLADAFLPFFFRLSGFSAFPLFSQPDVIIFSLLVCLVAGLAAAAYPAFYFSRRQPFKELKGRFSVGFGDGMLRKVLVAVQFTIAVALLIFSMVLQQQADITRRQSPVAQAGCFLVPGDTGAGNKGGLGAELFEESLPSVSVPEMAVWLKEIPAIGWPDFSAIENIRKKPIAAFGAVKAAGAFLKTAEAEIFGAILKTQRLVLPSSTAVRYDLVTSLNGRSSLYLTKKNPSQAEHLSLFPLAEVTGFSAILALVLACTGLSGLAAFTAEKRSREIGIRKLSGASVWEIILLLHRPYTKLILISVFIGVPLSFLAMDHWFPPFFHPVTVDPGVFLFSGIVTLLAGWAAVGYQSIKTALVNPVRSLKEMK